MKVLLFIFFWLLTDFTARSQKNIIDFEINSSLVDLLTEKENEVINFVKKYIEQCQDSTFNTSDGWLLENNKSLYPEFEFYSQIKNIKGSKLSIQLLSIENIGETGIYKFATTTDNNIESILKLLIKKLDGVYLMVNYYDAFSRVKPVIHNEIEYFLHSGDFNLKDVSTMLDFNSQLADFFGKEKLAFKYFMFDNSKELFLSLGYEYNQYMFDAFQNNSFARPIDHSIFSANGSALHKHELTHLYISTYLNSRPNKFLDEGLATYFGGSQGYSLQESTELLIKFVSEKDIDLDRIYKEHLFINNTVNIKNIIAGNFVKYIIEKRGVLFLLNMISKQPDNVDMRTLVELFMGKFKTVNEFILLVTKI